MLLTSRHVLANTSVKGVMFSHLNVTSTQIRSFNIQCALLFPNLLRNREDEDMWERPFVVYRILTSDWRVNIGKIYISPFAARRSLGQGYLGSPDMYSVITPPRNDHDPQRPH